MTGDAADPDGRDGPDESGRGAAGPTDPIWLRLAAADLDPEAHALVVAALHGDAELEAALRGEPAVEAPPVPPRSQYRPRRAYLRRVRVRGFRGIGREAVLDLRPGPGLTVVIGRNGSGKSSLAEAAEVALTGRSQRWEGMQTAWRDGWRNLHDGERTEASVELVLAGDRESTEVTRVWTGSSVRSAEGAVTRPGRSPEPLSTLGWDDDLRRYRPFLSYAEVGRTIEGRASELYDMLSALIGLTGLASAERRLARACRELSRRARRPGKELPELVAALREAAPGNQRAEAALAALEGPDIDLERVAGLAKADPVDPEELIVLRRTRRLAVPEESTASDVIDELRGAALELAMVAGTKSARAHGVIDLLRRALEHHAQHSADARCPVCGADDALGPDWAARAVAEIGALESTASGAEAAYARAEEAREKARVLLAPPPEWVPRDSELGRAWAEWSAGSSRSDLVELADHVVRAGRRLRGAAQIARVEAAHRLSEISEPTEGWALLADRLALWVERARDAEFAQDVRGPAERARAWLVQAARELRNERLRPLASQAEMVWRRLRQERHIDLGALRLIGSGLQRRVAVDVTLDGAESAETSPGVLSQGEMHALALAVCLPRTLAKGNPFGFLIVDDPVQAMDGPTVEGLADVLAQVGRHRQLVVFTHDTRLTSALRRLQLPATIRTITRTPNSEVFVR
ncbi:AAA family ATPase [Allonocardiopsis opalescens]|uniref:Nuclease SbcCD subunit C n=1 Tax=Allonocardiopsis opalescens TaxID=1144618 RepID=A0A2T0Q844_9ACTN|nr:AAA family ATPase [Allonocardiopsis opalescens]PRX99951.1 AAA domain-containing protein [Allonocardiopsis opalescens]